MAANKKIIQDTEQFIQRNVDEIRDLLNSFIDEDRDQQLETYLKNISTLQRSLAGRKANAKNQERRDELSNLLTRAREIKALVKSLQKKDDGENRNTKASDPVPLPKNEPTSETKSVSEDDNNTHNPGSEDDAVNDLKRQLSEAQGRAEEAEKNAQKAREELESIQNIWNNEWNIEKYQTYSTEDLQKEISALQERNSDLKDSFRSRDQQEIQKNAMTIKLLKLLANLRQEAEAVKTAHASEISTLEAHIQEQERRHEQTLQEQQSNHDADVADLRHQLEEESKKNKALEEKNQALEQEKVRVYQDSQHLREQEERTRHDLEEKMTQETKKRKRSRLGFLGLGTLVGVGVGRGGSCSPCVYGGM